MKNFAILGLMLMSITTAVMAGDDQCATGSEAATANESDVAKAQANKDSAEKADYRSQPAKSE